MTARAICSLANVAGIRLRDYFPICKVPYDLDKFNDLFLKVRNAGYEIVKRKGKTFYARAPGENVKNWVNVPLSLLIDQAFM